MRTSRNRIGALSLLGALAGFLIVTFQPWIPLDHVILYRALSLKALLMAFFDASLVGSLADWFAVSALFKNPLGVPLPHTDIIAKNKDAIAEAVPRFLTSFVSEEKIAVELVRVDFAAKVQAFLSQPDARGELHEFLRSRLSTLLSAATMAEGTRSEGLRTFTREMFSFARETLDPAAIFASVLRWARKEGLEEKIIENAAELLRVGIARNLVRLAAAITPILKRNAGWQGIFVGQGTIERLLQGVQNELAQVRSNPGHELRRMLSDALGGYAARLAGEGEDPGDERGRFRASVRRMLADEGLQERAAQLLAALLGRIGADLGGQNSRFFSGMERAESALAAQLGRNEAFRAGFNRGIAGLISGAMAKSNLIEGMTGYLATLLKSTDERDFVHRIEDAVWNDLQYIRVNGAVVGGLVGLLLSLLSGLL
ncbi:MAG: DUF445 domain-containing protein [Spirochaetia bacterium]|jgi:uncharacterized membrane-anchored protein YjiN (DUF445 family)